MQYNEEHSLERFVTAQAQTYDGYADALAEMRAGTKHSHWIWYILPQRRGLGSSEMAIYYGIADDAEAIAYLHHPILGPRLAEVTHWVVHHLASTDARVLMGSQIDVIKLGSCMQLFGTISAQLADVSEPWIVALRHDCAQVLELLNAQGYLPSV
ncbi:MAG: DUF1810 domain-containing protein [Chloroflexi bacterium]|nr:DUF1810 domain-containing protein [Chloroflexota bacterium]